MEVYSSEVGLVDSSIFNRWILLLELVTVKQLLKLRFSVVNTLGFVLRRRNFLYALNEIRANLVHTSIL